MLNEETLISEAIKNNAIAQRTLYERYSKAMFNTCLKMMHNDDEAKDTLQDAFIKAFTKLDSFDHNSTFGAWLKRIVINTCLNQINKNKKMIFVEEEQQTTLDTDYYDSELKVELIQKAIPQLADGYRQIISLYLFEGYDHTEISKILNISVSTSKSQYSRAKKKLKNIITDIRHGKR